MTFKVSLVLFLFLTVASLRAQDHSVFFNTTDPGVTKAIPHWGVDTAWDNPDHMRQGIAHMGLDEIDTVRTSFFVDEPLTDSGELGPKSKVRVARRMEIANMAGKPYTLLPATEDLVHEWYKDGKKIRADRWVKVIEATVKYLNRPVVLIEPFNEPDYGWGQGSPEDLREILKLMRQNPTFRNTKLGGPATLASSNASRWFNVIRDYVKVGSTHTLGGNFQSYIDFIKEVRARGLEASNPEPHSVAEVIAGAEYGLQDATWWGPPFRARGLFVRSSQGKRLAYAEDAKSWAAAAVYRAPDGVIRGFGGVVERQGAPISYRFLCADRAVYFDGEGPMRDFTMPLGKHDEEVVEITFGEDVPPALNGRRFVLVNRETGKVLKIGASSGSDAALLQSAEIDSGLNEKWEVTRAPGGYYTMKSVLNRKTATVGSFDAQDDGAPIRAFGDGVADDPDQWWFEYLGDGWFNVRNRLTCKFMQVKDAAVVQGSGNAGKAQEWRLFPADHPVDFTAPAAPIGLKATAREVAVSLDWESADTDVSKYTIYRSPKPGGPYEVITATSDNHFTDASANQKAPYYYVVQVTDHALNRSKMSGEVTATPAGGRGLVAHLEFDENVRDNTGNGNQATVHGAPKFALGKKGHGILLDGKKEYLTLPPAIVNSHDVTISAWIRWFSGGWGGNPTFQRVFDFASDTGRYMFLTPQSAEKTLRFAIKNGDQEQQLNAPALIKDEWTHVAVVLEGGTGKLYVNGVVADTQPITVHPSDFNPVINSIGRSIFPDPLFRGVIDDFRIYNYALPQEKIAELNAAQ